MFKDEIKLIWERLPDEEKELVTAYLYDLDYPIEDIQFNDYVIDMFGESKIYATDVVVLVSCKNNREYKELKEDILFYITNLLNSNK